jgi:hypothetical protein
MEQTWSKKIFSVAWKAALAVVLLLVLYMWLVLHWSYAKGERAGYLQKLSIKGWVCKTWEGELAMVNVPGALTEKFFFTVRDEAVAKRVSALLDKRVVLSYEQHVGVPTSCFGDTAYFVTDAREVTDTKEVPVGAPQVPPPPTPVPPVPTNK